MDTEWKEPNLEVMDRKIASGFRDFQRLKFPGGDAQEFQCSPDVFEQHRADALGQHVCPAGTWEPSRTLCWSRAGKQSLNTRYTAH